MLCKRDGSKVKAKIKEVFVFDGFEKEKFKRLNLEKFASLLVLKVLKSEIV